MRALGVALSLLHIVYIEATILNAKEDYDDIDNLIMEGNQTKYNAIVFLKPYYRNEEIDEQADYDKYFEDIYNLRPNPDEADVNDKNKDANNEEALIILPKSNDTKNIVPSDSLRGRISCVRHASKKCNQACKASNKHSCASHRCTKSLKKSLKKECKNKCKSFFP